MFHSAFDSVSVTLAASSTAPSVAGIAAADLPLLPLATVGLTALVLALIAALVVVALFSWNLFRRISAQAVIASVRGADVAGPKVLIANMSGKRSGKISHAVVDAFRDHLGLFNFGGNFHVAGLTVGGLDLAHGLTPEGIALLKDVAARADAAMVVIGRPDPEDVSLYRIAMIRREDLEDGGLVGLLMHEISADPDLWTDAQRQALAWSGAMALQPSLARPTDFRPERLVPVLEAVRPLLAEPASATGEARIRMADAYGAGAVFLSEALKDDEWRTQALEALQSRLTRLTPQDDPLLHARSRISLGRALLMECERKFDPARLDEAKAHIQAGIDALRGQPSLELMEAGLSFLKRAENVTDNRKRFSINWQG